MFSLSLEIARWTASVLSVEYSFFEGVWQPVEDSAFGVQHGVGEGWLIREKEGKLRGKAILRGVEGRVRVRGSV